MLQHSRSAYLHGFVLNLVLVELVWVFLVFLFCCCLGFFPESAYLISLFKIFNTFPHVFQLKSKGNDCLGLGFC